jgi:phage-related protein
MTNILYYTTTSGQNPIDKFLNSLSGKQQAKILRVFQSIKEYGLQSILPHVKKLSGTPLWEIRILGQDNLRVIYVVPLQDTVLILHGFIKKTQKTPKKEIETALNRYYLSLDK